MIIVITGKTASGKDTIIKSILQKFPNLKKITTTTSRQIRTGEKDGTDYHFIPLDQFKEKIRNNEFFEYVEYGGNMYGTEKKEFEGENLLWKIDPSMAGKVKNLDEKSIVIYITTSDEIVLRRLKKRGLSQEEITKRMGDDRKIWQEYQNNYDFIIENNEGELDKTINEVARIIQNSTQTNHE